jgi:hypothetical protein
MQQSISVTAAVPNAMNPRAATYRWELFGGNPDQPMATGTGTSFSFTPPQAGLYELRLVLGDGVRSPEIRPALNVLVQNVAPNAVQDQASTRENQSASVDVLANDTDPNSGQTLSIVTNSLQVLSMSRDSDGSSIPVRSSSVRLVNNRVEFLPGEDFDFLAPGQSATVRIGYTITDDHPMPLTASSVLVLTLQGENDAPRVSVAQPSVTVIVGQTATISGSVQDVDLGEAFTVTAPFGSVNVQPNGQWTWTYPTTAVMSSTPVTITARDRAGAESQASFSLNVQPVPTVPTVPPVPGTPGNPNPGTPGNPGTPVTPGTPGTPNPSNPAVQIPVATIVGLPTTSREGVSLSLSSPGSSAGTNTSWTITQAGRVIRTASTPNLNFVPTRPGSYSVELRVERNGQVSRDVKPLSVSAVDQGSMPLFTTNGPGGEITIRQRDGSVVASHATNSPVGTRSILADVNNDNSPELIYVTGPGVRTMLTIQDAKSGQVLGELPLYESSFKGSANIAAADFTGDGIADIAAVAAESGGARVTLFDGATRRTLADFFGIEDPNFRGGGRLAFGDVNGDGVTDLIVAAGIGGGPRVAVFDGRTLVTSGVPTRLFGDFFAYEPTLTAGVYISTGDVNNDGFDDMILGAGPGGAPRLMIWDSAQLTANGAASPKVLANYFLDDTFLRNGVQASAKDLDGDEFIDVVASIPKPTGTIVKSYLGRELVRNGLAPDLDLELNLPGVNSVYVG